MFVSVPTRSRASLRWATPLLAALLWAAFLWALSRSDASLRSLMLDWGALAGAPAAAGAGGLSLWAGFVAFAVNVIGTVRPWARR